MSNSDLHYLSIADAARLIGISHPNFRAVLTEQAKRMRII